MPMGVETQRPSATIGEPSIALWEPAWVMARIANLALVSQRSSFVMRVPNNTFQFGVNYVGQSVSSTLSVTSRGGGVLDWQQSAAFGTSTLTSAVTASFANFYGVQGCTGTVDVHFAKLP
jgi:hypothetical protein